MRGRYPLLWVLLGALLSTLAGAASFYYMRPHIPMTFQEYKPENVETPKKTEGYPFQDWKEAQRRRGLAVVIDNAPPARPQTGLHLAEVVLELPVEGGMTRFLAIFSRNEAELLGPIRSARPSFIDLAKEYNSILVHAGGSEEAYEALVREKPDNLNEIDGGPKVGAAFWRIPNRQKPHNLYASSESLRRAAKELNYNLQSAPQERPLISNLALGASGDEMEELTIYYPNRQSLARYVFDKKLRVFERYTGQEPHLTPQGQKILVSNVIVQYVPYRVVDGDGRLQLILHGEGKAKIYRDGKVINGLWQKQPGGFTKFVDNKGKVIPLMPGPTWINVVTNGTRVDY